MKKNPFEHHHGKFQTFLYDKALLKIIILIIVHIVLTSVLDYIPTIFSANIVINILTILIGAYFVLLIVHFLRTRIDQLLNPENIKQLISAYTIVILILLLLCSTVFNLISFFHVGYLTYGKCSDSFDPNAMSQDQDTAHNTLYFSAITFFSVGYGDICPMGYAKVGAVIVAFLGHLVSVIFVALIINNYIMMQSKKRRK